MKQILIFGVCIANVLIIFSIQGQSEQTENNISTISCADLHKKIQFSSIDKQGLYLVNVLPKDICQDCKIPGTLNVPFDKLQKKVQNWPKNREIVIHCAGSPCPLGRHAYELLIDLGFLNVWLFDGGLRSWKNQNLPTHGKCRAGYLKG